MLAEGERVNIDNLSLDQLRIFLAVVDEGSFSGAARRYRRAQSAVSYTISALEQSLGVELFSRDGYRPRLTPAGQTLATDIGEIVLRTERLKAHATAMSRGLEARLSLAVDAMYPITVIGKVLKELHEAFPTVAVGLFVDTLGSVADLVLEGRCALGVATLPAVPEGLTSHSIPGVLSVLVAAPHHPLALLPAPIPTAATRDFVQIVLTDRSRLTDGQDFGVFSRRTWRVSDLAAKRELLREGLGWGSMPAHLVGEDIAAGRLAPLHLEAVEHPGETLPVNALHRADAILGPATTWILERLKRQDLPTHPEDTREAAGEQWADVFGGPASDKPIPADS
ncbi:MAG: LysR family transcriptional regulator [Gemmobacter sp.]